MVKKYRGQLSAAGIEYDDIPEPRRAEVDAARRRAQKPSVIDFNGKKFVLTFEYDRAVVDDIRRLPARYFDWDAKIWYANPTADNLAGLESLAERHHFDITDSAKEKLQELQGAAAERKKLAEKSRATDDQLHIEGLGGTLRPFQEAGVAYAVQTKSCFIADDMGLGKTVQALAAIHAQNAYPVIVVCPATLKLNWEREARKWLPGKSIEVWASKGERKAADVVIVNYDIITKLFDELTALQHKAIIFDESHFAKNSRAQRTKSALKLAKQCQVKLALTGTPVMNRPQELVSQLKVLGRLDDFGGFWPFVKRYCGAYSNGYGLQMDGADHLEELNEKLRGLCFIRREKSQVLTELPAKQRAMVPVELSNATEYAKAEADFLQWLFETESAEAADKAMQAEQLVRIEKLKQLSARGKMEAVMAWVENFLESGQKLVLFAWHKEVVKELAERFNAPYIMGDVDMRRRQDAVDRFQNDQDCKLIVMNMQSGGVGLTLTAASNVAFIELGWNPATHDQAEDRCHRIGQEDSVTAWYFLGQGTIDNDIQDLIEKKRTIVQAAVDGKAPEGVSVLNELLERCQQKGDAA
jgi:SNF2 family DNA or RNA helicase